MTNPLPTGCAALCAIATIAAAAPQSPTWASFGSAMAVVSDVNSDGQRDVATVWVEAGEITVLVLSGADGSWITSFPAQLGKRLRMPNLCFVPFAPDAQGMLAVSAVEADTVAPAVSIEVYSLKTLQRITSLSAESGESAVGREMVALGDLDGDGAGELLVQTMRPDLCPETSVLGYAVYSLPSGARTRSIAGSPHGRRCSEVRPLCTVGDINQDGVVDYGVRDETNAVVLFSGRTGETLRTLRYKSTSDCFGHGIACVGDIDGDRVDDTVVTLVPDQGVGGSFVIYSGTDGKLLADIRPNAGLHRLGSGFSLAPDLDRDGVKDLALSGFGEFESFPGGLMVVSSKSGAILSQMKGVVYSVWRIDSCIDTGPNGLPYLVYNRHSRRQELGPDRAIVMFEAINGEPKWEVTASTLAAKAVQAR